MTKLAVAADLTLRVTAPDGSAARIRVTDSAGELVVDVDQPLTVAKALPTTTDLRSLTRQLARYTDTGGSIGAFPNVRLRTGGVTVAVSRNGRPRPGAAVVGAAAVTLSAVGAVIVALVSLVRRLSRRPG